MTSVATITSSVPALALLQSGSIQEQIHSVIEEILGSLPRPDQFSAEQRRGVIARYGAVLEGNFIYWMTGAYIAARTEQARAIILDNLREEVRDSHPAMMRRFAVAAHAVPSESDGADVYRDMNNVRLFVGRLSILPLLLMMAFFEGLIQKFMPYLAELARLQGSNEMEYTDVHGVCDIAHTAALFRALEAEAAVSPFQCGSGLFEGVELLRALLQTIIHGRSAAPSQVTD